MATVVLNALDCTSATYTSQSSDKSQIKLVRSYSGTYQGLVSFETLNIPTPSIISATMNFEKIGGSNVADDETVFFGEFSTITPINGFRFDPNNYTLYETVHNDDGKGGIKSIDVNSYFLKKLANNVVFYVEDNRSLNTLLKGVSSDNKPYITVNYSTFNTSYKPTCRLAYNKLMVSGRGLSNILWYSAEDVYGDIISKYEIILKNQTTGVETTYQTTGNVNYLPPSVINDRDIYTIRIRATTIYGVVGDWYESNVRKDSNVFPITGTSPNNEVFANPSTIRLEWTAGYQQQYELFISKDGNIFESVLSATSTNRYCDLDVSTYEQGKYYWKVFTKHYTDGYLSKPLPFTIGKTPTISNLTYQGEYWEQHIIMNWRSEYQTGYEYECYYNNIKVLNGSGGIEKQFTIPASTFKGLLPSSVRVRTKNTVGTETFYSDWVEIKLSLKDITATVSSLLIEGDYWEKQIKVSWQSTNQQQFKIEVFKSNSIVKTYTGTTANRYIIPPEELGEGQYTIRVTVAYANRYVNSIERTVTFKSIIPTIDNLALSGSNIDLALVLSWTSTDQQKLEVDILKNDLSVKTYTGTVANLVNIPNNTLTTGLHKFRVRVAYKDRWSEWKEITSNLTETLPSIGILEPDGIITKRDEPTIIKWDSQNQSKWKLVIDGTTTYTGTTEKKLILEAGKLQTGQHSMVLTVWYVTGLGVEKPPVTKKAEWIVQGVPPTPTITSADMFNTNRPITTWDTQDQQGYVLEALKGADVVYSTDWQNGLIVQHKINDYLENGTYTIRVKVMNKYELESDWGTKQITINAIEDTDITLKSIVIGNSVQLTWDNLGDKFVKFYIIRNNTVIAKTTGTTYTDYTAHRDCIYTIRGITVGDVYKDSNRVYEQVEIDRSILATVEQPQDQLKAAFFTDTDRFNATLGLECKLVEASGREYPIAVFGEHSSKAINLKLLQCDSLDRLIEMFNRRQVFCYRDGAEKVYFIIQSLPYNRDSLLRDHEGTINATVVDYKESVEYD